MASKTIYESAYNGDYDYVKSKLDEEPSLLTKLDEVSKCLLLKSHLTGLFAE